MLILKIVLMSPTHFLSGSGQEIQQMFSTILYCFFLVYINYSVLGHCPAVTDGPLGNTCVKKVLRMPLESLRIWGHS